MSKRRILIGTLAAFALQVVALAGMIARYAHALHNGESVILNAEPVDPRHPLLGFHLVMQFPISAVEERMIRKAGLAEGQTVYAVLEKDREAEKERWRIAGLHGAMPAFSPVRPVLRARLLRTANYTLRYGIERYYLPEKDARDMETALAEGGLQLEVAVSPSSGHCAIRRLLVNGEPKYEDPLFWGQSAHRPALPAAP